MTFVIYEYCLPAENYRQVLSLWSQGGKTTAPRLIWQAVLQGATASHLSHASSAMLVVPVACKAMCWWEMQAAVIVASSWHDLTYSLLDCQMI